MLVELRLVEQRYAAVHEVLERCFQPLELEGSDRPKLVAAWASGQHGHHR